MRRHSDYMTSEERRILDVALARASADALSRGPAELRWTRCSSYARQILGNDATVRLLRLMSDTPKRQ